jgi:hypothetical protein
MRLTMARVWTVGLFVGVLVGCGKDDGGGGGSSVESLCKKLIDCGSTDTVEDCSAGLNMCSNIATQSEDCAGMSGCEAILGCYIGIALNCVPEGSTGEDPTEASGGTTSATDATSTTDATTTDATPTTGDDPNTTTTGLTSDPDPEPSTGGDTSTTADTDVPVDPDLYGPCGAGEPPCPGDQVCADTVVGTFCSPPCVDMLCPGSGVSAAAECVVLADDVDDEPDYCALICDLNGPADQCPAGLSCEEVPLQEIGICAEF